MKRLRPWLCGLVFALAILAALSLALGLRFDSASETLVLKAFAGYVSGKPVHYHPELGTLLSWLLYGLSAAFPGVAWYSVMQLVALGLCCAVIVKAFWQIAEQAGLSAFTGALAGVVTTLGVGLFALCRLSHIQTAALLGAAAVAQLMSLRHQSATDTHVFSGTLGVAGLAALALLSSELAGLAAGGFVLLTALCIRLTDYGRHAVAARGSAALIGLRGLMLGMAVMLFLLAGLTVMRRAELHAMPDHIAWQTAYRQITSHPAFPDDIGDAVLTSAGWTREQLELLASGYHLTLQTSELQALAASLGTAEGRTLAQAFTIFWQSLRDAHLLPLAAVLLVMIVPQWLRARKGRLRAWLIPLLSPLAAVGALCAMSFFFTPDRAQLLCVLAPAITLQAALTLRSLHELPRLARWLACAVCAALLCFSTAAMVTDAASLPQEGSDFTDAVSAYAVDHPQKLILFTPALYRDTRLFPPLESVPANLILPDVRLARSPELRAQLLALGIESGDMRPRDFLLPDVLVAGTTRGPWKHLHAYLSPYAKGTLNWAMYEQQDELCLYRLYQR